jgi:Uma2 family endonuclease
MNEAPKWKRVSVRDYLAGELCADVKHEYLCGVLYAMAGEPNVHNEIAGHVYAELHLRLKGRPCTPFKSDVKIRIRKGAETRFYYPDGSVVCRPNPPDDSFQDEPVVITEVISRQTRRIDEGEKKDAYETIPSLKVYILVEQYAPLVSVFRRTGSGFVGQVHLVLNAVIPLPEIDTALPLADIYGGIQFVPEAAGGLGT